MHLRGSFATEPSQGGDSDVRTTYCAFIISSLLQDWSGIDVDRALTYIAQCRVRSTLSYILHDSYPKSTVVRRRIRTVSFLRGQW